MTVLSMLCTGAPAKSPSEQTSKGNLAGPSSACPTLTKECGSARLVELLEANFLITGSA